MIGSVLKELLSRRGMRVGELSRLIDVPAQTLYSIIKRDNMKIDFDVLLRICRALDAPIELFCGELKPSSLPEAKEWELIRRYRELDEHGRDMVDTVFEKEYLRISEKKKTAERIGGIFPDKFNRKTGFPTKVWYNEATYMLFRMTSFC